MFNCKVEADLKRAERNRINLCSKVRGTSAPYEIAWLPSRGILFSAILGDGKGFDLSVSEASKRIATTDKK